MEKGMWLGLAGAIALAVGCGGTPAPADAGPVGMDAPMGCQPFVTPTVADAGAPPATVMCPTPDGGIPGMGPCCYRTSQLGVADPEARIRFLQIDAPVGSPLSSAVAGSVLNGTLANETFNWLVRVEGASAGGAVNIVTGFGIRAADGSFTFPDGTAPGTFNDPRYLPVMIPGTIAGDVVTSQVATSALVVPILNADGTAIQLELQLHGLHVLESQFNTDRSCVGWAGSRMSYHTGGVLEAFVLLSEARTGVVSVPGVNTTICGILAGSLSDPMYCDQPQSAWSVPPDSVCDATGCRANTSCMEDVCNADGGSAGGLPGCDAWHLVSEFAAQGVSITN